MVGIELEEKKKTAHVRLAKQWSRDDLNKIPIDVKALHTKIKWTDTFAEQLMCQSLIRNIEHKSVLVSHTITTPLFDYKELNIYQN